MFGATFIVFADQFLGEEFLDVPHGITADIPQCHFALFNVTVNKPNQLLSTLFGERRYRNPYDLTIVGRIQSQLGFSDRLLYCSHRSSVPWLDHEHSWLGN